MASKVPVDETQIQADEVEYGISGQPRKPRCPSCWSTHVGVTETTELRKSEIAGVEGSGYNSRSGSWQGVPTVVIHPQTSPVYLYPKIENTGKMAVMKDVNVQTVTLTCYDCLQVWKRDVNSWSS